MGNGTSCRSIRTVIKLEIKHFVIWLIARILLIFIVGYICNRMVISYIAQRTKQSCIDWPVKVILFGLDSLVIWKQKKKSKLCKSYRRYLLCHSLKWERKTARKKSAVSCKESKHPVIRTYDFRRVQADHVLIYRVLSGKSAWKCS